MKKKLYLGIVIAVFTASVAYATERAANKYAVHKLALNSVLISCNDEREPVVRKLDSGPFVIVSCETGK